MRRPTAAACSVLLNRGVTVRSGMRLTTTAAAVWRVSVRKMAKKISTIGLSNIGEAAHRLSLRPHLLMETHCGACEHCNGISARRTRTQGRQPEL